MAFFGNKIILLTIGFERLTQNIWMYNKYGKIFELQINNIACEGKTNSSLLITCMIQAIFQHN